MTKLAEFLKEFELTEADIGTITRLGRRCFLTLPEHADLIAQHRGELFGCGVYLGEEKERMEPSPALLELIAAKTKEFKVVVNSESEWLFLCGRDILDAGLLAWDQATSRGLVLVQNEADENLGFGILPKDSKLSSARQRHRMKGVAIKHVLDRGFFLRRERLQ